jgi:hypothetical protein
MPAPPNVDAELVRFLPGVEAAWASGWTPTSARAAVDAHKLGQFTWTYQLAIDCTSYPPIKAALDQRLAEPEALPWAIEGSTRAPGRFETEAAVELWEEDLQPLVRSTLRDHALLGMAVWQHPIVWDDVFERFTVSSVEWWPLSAVVYLPFGWLDDLRPGYYAINNLGERIRLPKPGTTDGHWTVLGEGNVPHLDGAICALDVSFTKGQLARRAEANLSDAIGRASVVGELPPDVNINSPEGKDMLAMLRDLGSKIRVGIHMSKARVYPFEIATQTGELFPQLLEGDARHVAWALLGVDATLGRGENVYNDPTLQSVPQHLKRRDVGTVERGASNLFAAISALNQGERAQPPRLVGHLPDAEQDARRESVQKRRAADDAHLRAEVDRLATFSATLAAARAAGFTVDQQYVEELAAIIIPMLPVPQLPAGAQVTSEAPKIPALSPLSPSPSA